ncbi:MAG: HTTM domain-containing protein, partial [Planctomycetia bacterium]
LAHTPMAVEFLTHLTVVFELSFCVLVWNRWLRPFYLLTAVGLHMGIGLFMGMMTFGVAMLFGVAAFIDPKFLLQLAAADEGEAGPSSRSG